MRGGIAAQKRKQKMQQIAKEKGQQIEAQSTADMKDKLV